MYGVLRIWGSQWVAPKSELKRETECYVLRTPYRNSSNILVCERVHVKLGKRLNSLFGATPSRMPFQAEVIGQLFRR